MAERPPWVFPSASNLANLPATSLGVPETLIWGGEAREPRWRIVEVASESNLPFQARVKWGYRGGVGPFARFDVPSARRACVFGNNVQVFGENQVNETNSVRVLCSDTNGALKTENTYSRLLTTPAGQVVDVPPFAYELSFFSSAPPAAVTAQFEGPTGTVYGVAQGIAQLHLPTAIASRVRFTCAADCTVCFHLMW